MTEHRAELTVGCSDISKVQDRRSPRKRQFNDYYWPEAKLLTHVNSPASLRTVVWLKGVDRRRVSGTNRHLVNKVMDVSLLKTC